jgi:hypothetical protein
MRSVFSAFVIGNQCEQFIPTLGFGLFIEKFMSFTLTEYV